jgi:hypothetical protein
LGNHPQSKLIRHQSQRHAAFSIKESSANNRQADLTTRSLVAPHPSGVSTHSIIQ